MCIGFLSSADLEGGGRLCPSHALIELQDNLP